MFDPTADKQPSGFDRRGFLTTGIAMGGALGGAVGLGLGLGLGAAPAPAAAAAASEAQPIDDFRAGGEYRRQMVEVLVTKGLNEIALLR